MALTPANIYHGPAATVTLGGSDLGSMGENNVLITYEPAVATLHDGQQFHMYGLGRVEVELTETDATHLATISAAKSTAAALVVTGLNGKVYTLVSMIFSYKTKRQFGEEPHMVIISAQKKVTDEDDFVTIT